MKITLSKILSMFVPHGFIAFRDRVIRRKWELEMEKITQERKQRIAKVSQDKQRLPYFDYKEAVSFLSNINCDENQVREGSIDEESLKFFGKFFPNTNSTKPLVGIHIGNFVGISLAYFANVAVSVHPNSIVFSIDPNLTCRGIGNPMQKVIELLNYFHLNNNVSILTGYSLEKSISNDGLIFDDYNPSERYEVETACENQLQALSLLVSERFDFAVVDGNHEGEYFERELNEIDKLLKPNGYLFLDDISWQWEELKEVYDVFKQQSYEEAGTTDRVAVLRKISGNN